MKRLPLLLLTTIFVLVSCESDKRIVEAEEEIITPEEIEPPIYEPAAIRSFNIIIRQGGEDVSTEGVFSEDSSVITISPASQRWISNLDSAAVEFEASGTVWVGDTEQISGETTNDFRKELIYTVKNEKELKSYTVTFLAPQTTGLPLLRIHTEDNAEILDKENYVPSVVQLTNTEDPTYELEATAGVRGRGNTTWAYPKKPYRIKFDDKISMFGLGAAKNWVLLANYLDPTFIMNTVAFEIGSWLRFDFVNHTNHAELFLNDEYLGNYVVTEHVQVNEHRVDIDEETDFLVEIDRYYDEDYKFKTPYISLPVNIKSPELDDEAGMAVIQEAVNGLEEALYGRTAGFPNNNYADLIDIPTLIDYILVNEIVRNRELLIPGSVYMYKKGNDKMKMGPLWDFDCGFGYTEVGHIYYANAQTRVYRAFERYAYGTGGDFFARFFQDPAFEQAYRERWNEIKGMLPALDAFIDSQATYLLKSSLENNKRWNKNFDIIALTAQMKAWLHERIEYLDGDINRE